MTRRSLRYLCAAAAIAALTTHAAAQQLFATPWQLGPSSRARFYVLDTAGRATDPGGSSFTLRPLGGTPPAEPIDVASAVTSSALVNRRVTLVGELTVTGATGGARLWIRAVTRNAPSSQVISDPINGAVPAALSMIVPDGTVEIRFGVQLTGAGTVRARGLRIEIGPDPNAASQPAPASASSPLIAASERARFGQQAASANGAGGSVTLTFDWKPGLAATIEAERLQTRHVIGRRTASTAALKYRMRVRDHRSGRLIDYDNFEILHSPASGSPEEAMMQRIASLVPNLIVSREGEFLRIENMAALKASMRKLFEPIQNQLAKLPPSVKNTIDALTDDETLTIAAASDWQMLVGAWVGFEGIIGQMQEDDIEEASPFLPGEKIPMRMSYGALQRTACEPGRTPDSCVVMRLQSRLAPEAMERMLNRFGASILGESPITFERVNVTTEVRTTLEPQTMKPYEMTSYQTVDMLLAIPGGERATLTQSDRRTYKLKYN